MSIFHHKSSLSMTSPYRTQVSLQHRRNNYLHSSLQETEDDIQHEQTTKDRSANPPTQQFDSNKHIK